MTIDMDYSELVGMIQAAANPAWAGDEFKKRYHGTPHRYYGLPVPARRKVAKDWARTRKGLSFEDWLAMLDRLYGGESYEEHAIAGELLALYPRHRQGLPLDRLYDWLGKLEGWAEVDHTCQNNFGATEVLARWDDWAGLYARLVRAEWLARRRASLVLLVRPLRESADARLWQQAQVSVRANWAETDVLITKAVSWVLRSALTHHREDVLAFVDENAGALPKVAVREVRRAATEGD